jgi:pimeloyl-ACP methyl ester carboxylesterase
MNRRLMVRFFFCIIVLISNCIISKNTTYILIHGTWSRNTTWHQEGGGFYDALYSAVDEHDSIMSFFWSGALSESARNEAAEMLVSLIEIINDMHIVLVGHSHGGNVAMTVVRWLYQTMPDKRIQAVVLLGTPQYYRFEIPENVDFIYNLFSFGDQIQPVFNVFRREIPESSKTANLALLLENREPDHHLLYHPLIGFYLPQLVWLQDRDKMMISDDPHIASFSWVDGFQFISDIDRKEKIKEDLFKQERLLTYILWGPSELLYFYP